MSQRTPNAASIGPDDSLGSTEAQGSYFLTYHRWANREQVLACHPRLPEFLALKRKHDPHERFQSDWYRHYRKMI